MNHSRYLLLTALLIAGLLLPVALFNYLVDPFDRFQHSRSEGFNQYKPEIVGMQRLTKAYVLEGRQVETLIVGSSRSGEGIPCAELPGEPGSCYNASLAGANMRELRMLVQHAQDIHPLRHLLLGVDFISFLKLTAVEPPFDAQRLRGNQESEDLGAPLLRLRDSVQLLLSSSALRASLRTVYGQRGQLVSNGPALVDGVEDGSWRWVDGIPPMEEREWLARYLQQFTYTYNFYLHLLHRTLPAGTAYADILAMHLGEYRTLLEFCLARGIQPHIFLGPEHTSFQMAIMDAGRLPHYLAWRRAIGEATAAVYAAAGLDAPPVVDFAASTPAARMAMPAPGAAGILQWFLDGSHYAPAYGGRIARHLLGQELIDEAPYRPAPLRTDDSAAVEARMLDARRRYEQSHPGDARRLQRLLENFRRRPDQAQ